MTRRLAMLAVLTVTTSVLAGCGGSGSETASTPAQLVAKADPICKQVAVKRAAANASVTKASNRLQALARLTPAIATEEQQAVTKLRDIKAPSSLASDWRELILGMQQVATYTKQLGSYAKANNTQEALRVVNGAGKVRQHLTTIATRDGFTYCGRTI